MSRQNITSLTGDRVLVELTVGAQMYGSIVIPTVAQKIESYGKVLMVGPDVKDVAPGQKVLVAEHAGVEVDSDRSTRTVLYRTGDIIAIMED